MEVGYPMQQLITDKLPLDGLQFGALLEGESQVGLHELEDCVDMHLLGTGGLGQFVSVIAPDVGRRGGQSSS